MGVKQQGKKVFVSLKIILGANAGGETAWSPRKLNLVCLSSWFGCMLVQFHLQ